jgi:hypothetical protein
VEEYNHHLTIDCGFFTKFLFPFLDNKNPETKIHFVVSVERKSLFFFIEECRPLHQGLYINNN